MTDHELTRRITAYLTGGGLFNPEMANHERVRDLLIDCRDALAQPEQEPVAWMTRRTGDGGVVLSGYETCKPTDYDAIPVYTTLHSAKGTADLAKTFGKPEQEPVAWKYDWYGHKSAKEPRVLVKDWIASVYTEVSDPTINAHNIRPLYAAPPKREWVGMTSEDWENTPDTGKQGCERDAELFDWIEQTLKEKNT